MRLFLLHPHMVEGKKVKRGQERQVKRPDLIFISGTHSYIKTLIMRTEPHDLITS
jgi:hypothetical protein